MPAAGPRAATGGRAARRARAFARTGALLLALALAWPALAGGPGDTERVRRTDTTFTLGAEPRVELENRYGNVAVTTWARAEARVEIVVRARDRDAWAAQETLDGVHTYQVLHGNLLRLETSIQSTSKGLRKFWEDLGASDRSGLDVEYRLTLPAHTRLHLSNAFGNVYLEGLERPVQVELSYGDLRMGQVPPGSRLTLESGQLILGQAPDLRLDLDGADLELREAGTLRLTSQSSRLHVERADRIEWTSKRDAGRIEQVNELDADAHFSDLVVERLRDRADLTWTLGKLDLQMLEPSCREVRLTQKNADVEVNVEGLDLDLQAYLEGGKLIAPKELGKLDVELLDVKREIRTITGRVGTGVHQLVLKGDGGQVALFR